MSIQDLRKKLLDTDDKFSIFKDEEILDKYNIKYNELVEIANEFLDGRQKIEVLKLSFIFMAMDIKYRAELISDIDDDIKFDMLKDEEFMELYSPSSIAFIITQMSNDLKVRILNNPNIFDRYRKERSRRYI